MARIEGTQRILRNVLQPRTQRATRVLLQSRAAPSRAEKLDVAGVRRKQPEHDIGARTLARSRFADDTHDLALAHAERHVVERDEVFVVPRSSTRITLADAVDAQHVVVRQRPPRRQRIAHDRG